MKIIFLRAYDFPLGGAPQNRLLGICRGLIRQGHNVEVHQYAPSKLSFPLNNLKSQDYQGVKIINHAWKWSPIKSKSDQILGLMSGIIMALFCILKKNRLEPVEYLFINSEKNYLVLPFFIAAKFIKAKLGRDLNEYPLMVLNPEKFTKLQCQYKLLTNYKWFDVVFIISKNLISYYSPYLRKKTKILYLPVTVDFDRFPTILNSLANMHFITYCGDLSQKKDGVITLVRAFASISSKFPYIKLRLIGQNSDPLYTLSLGELISDLGLSEDVILEGYINPHEIPDELYKSRLNVLSRPDTIQSRGGFPTKLGEYLATGIPVAVTSVGEIPFYLMDEENAFLAEPDNVESFANAMERALCNPDLALKVGLAGRKTALEYFSHFTQGEVISNFLTKNC